MIKKYDLKQNNSSNMMGQLDLVLATLYQNEGGILIYIDIHLVGIYSRKFIF